MPELAHVWKALFAKELELAGEEADHPGGKVVRFSVDLRTMTRECLADKEFDEWMEELTRSLGDLCPKCREKTLNGADVGELDERCSELLREGIGEELKSDTAP